MKFHRSSVQNSRACVGLLGGRCDTRDVQRFKGFAPNVRGYTANKKTKEVYSVQFQRVKSQRMAGPSPCQIGELYALSIAHAHTTQTVSTLRV